MDPALTPAAAPPPGHESNFVNPPDLMPAVIASLVVIQVITILFISARAYVNIITRTVRPEDILSYLSYCALTAQMILICMASLNGTARHIWDVSMASLIPGIRLYNFVFIFYTISGGLAKACVFLQLKRIFTTILRGVVYWIIIGSFTVNAIAYTIFFFLYVFACTPREKIWNSATPGTCLDLNKLHMGTGFANIISDIEAFVVPVWAIWQLRLTVRKKLEVFAVFAIGALAVVIGCVGMYYRVLIFKRYDYTWLVTKTAIICTAELSVVIIVGCCPCLPRIVRQARTAYTSNNTGTEQSLPTSSPPSNWRSNSNPFSKNVLSHFTSRLASLGSDEHAGELYQPDGTMDPGNRP